MPSLRKNNKSGIKQLSILIVVFLIHKNYRDSRVSWERMLVMTFKTIETQEELDKIIESRLARQKESLEKQFADYDQLKTRNEELQSEVSTLKSSIEESSNAIKSHEQTVADLNKKVADYETANLRTRIAVQNGLPIDLADRLMGSDEESIKADAERLAGFVSNKQQTPPPLRSTEKPLGEGKDAPYKNLIENLNLEGE
jgi:septal ring factor EnvC (AmiA/AmiB activator)